LPRLPEAARTRYTEGVERMVSGMGKLLEKLGAKNPESLALSVLSEMAGTLTLSRAILDPERSNEMLRTCGEMVKERLATATARE
jgi:TetR/AcrR family transcriptional regulator, transcriptional repressor for nem operon